MRFLIQKYTAAEGGRKFSGFEVNLALGFGLYVFFNTPGGVGGSGDLSGRVLYSGFLSGWSPMSISRITGVGTWDISIVFEHYFPQLAAGVSRGAQKKGGEW